MIVDVIILTDSTNIPMTQRTIITLHDSEEDHIFHIQLIDSGDHNPNKYHGFHNYIHPESKFNYNAYLNIGFAYTTADWVVISNDDVAYEHHWFTEMMNIHNERPDIESFSPRDPVLYAKYFPYHFIGSPSRYCESHVVTEFLEGWCIAIKKTALDKIRPFDEQFDMYYQDNDFSEMLIKEGIKHAMVRYSMALHMNTLKVGELTEQQIIKLKEDEIKFRTKWNQWNQ
jgi:GT2 family glycosyltransferase